ncbi:GNAT family N-acetyltransferase [Arthrobacter sp. JCM 19049]|uniref:GNAT family N-acetyltransferase n=1 Tax=Arthrobacter sp. JCM 19049 TaxID=1460643 RepID=UPI000A7ED7D3|nr:GNAT family N-acetyltransferase [Arthrobacter sp. JCM 19049]
MVIQVGHGFSDDERPSVAELYWQAFRRKLRSAFSSDERGLSIVRVSLRSDRTFVARTNAGIVGMCGYRQAGIGAVSPTFRMLRGELPISAALRATLVLSPLARSYVSDVLVLDGICVADEQRGRGTGTALLEAAGGYARASGLRAVRLSVVDTNPRAEALYRRRGFLPVDGGTMGPLASIYGFDRYITMEKEVSQ